MAFTIVDAHDDKHNQLPKLLSKKAASKAAIARLLKPGEHCTVRSDSGAWEGWYYTIGVDKLKPNSYWHSRPQMEY